MHKLPEGISSVFAVFSGSKKAALKRFMFLAIFLSLIAGALYVLAAHDPSASTISPSWAAAGENQSYNLTISNAAGGEDITTIEVDKPNDYTGIFFLNGVPAGCTVNTNSTSSNYVKLTTCSVAAGSSITLNLTATTAPTAGTYNFALLTNDGISPDNTTLISTSVDTTAPLVDFVSVDDGTNTISTVASLDGSNFLSNASDITFTFTSSDSESGVASVTFYYNNSNSSDDVTPINIATPATYDAATAMSGSGTYTSTLTAANIFNGTRVVFVVVANDTVRNGNLSAFGTGVSYNFTVDAAAPVLSIPNINETLGTDDATVDNITKSTTLHAINVTVKDDGGSGVLNVTILNTSTGEWVQMSTISSGVYSVISSFADIGLSTAGLNNISYRATDNVSNVAYLNFTVTVDDTDPAFTSVASNLTTGNNVTTNVVSINSTLSFTLNVADNLDNTTQNITVQGNVGSIFNMTMVSGDTATGAVYTYIVQNLTVDFCAIANTDGAKCNIMFMAYDVIGRSTTTNLTITVDVANANVSISSPAVGNYSGQLVIGAFANDTIGPIANISFRWANGTKTGGADEGMNYSNWMPFSATTTLTSGVNSFENVSGYWQIAFVTTSLVEGNYSIEFNVTDEIGNSNTTEYVDSIVIDYTAPTIEVKNPATNSFHKEGFTLNITVNDTITGALNNMVSNITSVTYRRENSTTDVSDWTDMTALSSNPDGSTNYTANIAIDSVENGNYSFSFNATDYSGNSYTGAIINVTLDTVVPSGLTFVYPTDNLNQTGNFTVNVTFTESDPQTVAYRWVNDSSGSTETQHRSAWITMSRESNTAYFSATFTNMTDDSFNFLDGNYSIELNVTDMAGWNSTSSIQLVLDNTVPVVVAVAPSINTFKTTDFVINVTINDTASWNPNMGLPSGTNIVDSVTAILINTSGSRDTGNSVSVTMTEPTTAAEGNYSNATFTFTDVANGVFDINISVTDTAGNTNYTILTNVSLDNSAPSVSVLNTTPLSTAGALTGAVWFNATITDNLGFGPNGLDNTSVNMTVILVSSGAIVNSTATLTRATGSIDMWNASFSTTTLADGDYYFYVNATDKTGNSNSSEYILVNVQNGATSISVNRTIDGGYFSGISTNDGTPTVLINTSERAICKYAFNSEPVQPYYEYLTSTMTQTGAVGGYAYQHSAALGSQNDASSYNFHYACVDNKGNTTAPMGEIRTLTFGVDTRGLYNITIPGATDGNWPNYWSAAPSSWHSFSLSGIALASTSLSTAATYNTTQVLASVDGNYNRVYAYNASSDGWQVFIAGVAGNTLVNFTGHTIYWINVTTQDRLELN